MQLASVLSRQVLVRADVHVVYGVSCFPSLSSIAHLLVFFSFDCSLLITAARSSSSACRSGVPLCARCSSASPAFPFGRQVNDACSVLFAVLFLATAQKKKPSTVLLVRCDRRTFSPLRFVVRMVPVRRPGAPMACAPCAGVQPKTAPSTLEVGARWPTALDAHSTRRRWVARHTT